MKSKIENCCNGCAATARLSKSKIGGGALAVFCVLLPTAASACVGCREPGAQTLDHESPTVMAGMAFSWSVLFMLVFALLVVGGMSAYIWHTCQRIERERVRS